LAVNTAIDEHIETSDRSPRSVVTDRVLPLLITSLLSLREGASNAAFTGRANLPRSEWSTSPRLGLRGFGAGWEGRSAD